MRRSTIALIAIAAVFVVLAITLKSTGTGAPADTTTTTPDSTVAAPSTTTSPTTTSTTLPPGVAVCDLHQSITTTGQVAASDLVEASGLAASRTTADVLWSHNDSRGSATLFAFATDGEDLGAFDVPGAFALDWEDISAGPGPSGEDAYLYVGDIGDNFGIRGGLVAVYRVGDIAPSDLAEAFPESIALTYRYPDGVDHNAEALFIDPSDPALYLMTKGKDATFVFRGSLEPSSGPIGLELVTTLFLGAEVTAADMSLDGSTLAVRGYDTVWMWHRGAEMSIHDLLAGEPCEAPSPEERQGEAITLDAELSYWTVSEGSNSAVQMVRRES
jgi:hypothetical protein